MSKEIEFDVEKYHTDFRQIVLQANRINIEQAAQLFIDSGFDVMDLISLNNNSRDCCLVYMDQITNEYETLEPFENVDHIALILDAANNLKNK